MFVPLTQEEKERLASLKPEDINDRQVAKVLRLLQAWPVLVEYGGTYFAAVIKGRLYIAYLKS